MLFTLLVVASPFATPLPPRAESSLACVTMNTTGLPLATRKSPLDSISFTVGGASVKLCYGRPSARGRTMIGGKAIPFGRLWRTGANEPTMLHTTGPLVVAGVAVPAGSYSLYTVPDSAEWTIILNRSITQWGHEAAYTDEVRRQEAGQGRAPRSTLAAPVETLTLRAESAGDGKVALLLEWETTRVSIPVAPGQ